MPTDTIHDMLSSPAWWFSTLAVGLVVNLLSSLIYDRLKEWTPSLTSKRLFQIAQLVWAALFLISSILIAPSDA
jgi:hypothetical protein